MKEILRTNDLVAISFAQALLKDAGIAHDVFDTNMSNLEGGILAIQRRLLVLDEDVEAALQLLGDADFDVG